MDDEKYSVLWVAILKWAASSGAKDIGNSGKLWEADTVAAAGLGPFKIKINGSKKKIGYVPPFTAAVIDPELFIDLVAICDPRGGMVLGGTSEDELISHFDAQPALASQHHA